MNNWILSGRVGKDAEIKQTQSGNVVKFTLATDVTSKGEKKTMWTDVSWFNGSEKLAAFIKKGAIVAVSGRPQPRHYTAKNTNQIIDVCDMVANIVEILAFANNGEKPAGQSTAQPNGQTNDDLPF